MNLQRLNKFREILKKEKVDAFLVSNYYNILYLSGFATLVDNEREAWLFVTQDNQYLFSDERYLNTNSSKKFLILTPEAGLIKQLTDIIKTEKISSVGFEGEDLKYFEFEKFNQFLKNTKLISTNRLIAKIREIKDVDEIENLKKSCEITDQCFSDIGKTIRIGTSEKEITFKMEMFLKDKGHDFSFYPIVAIDNNSAIAHYDTRSGNNEKVKNGSIVLIDFGVKYKKYLSDMTRMIFVGEVNNEIINTYQNLSLAQEKTIQYINMVKSHDNYPYKEVDKFCRQKLVEVNLPNYSHSTGHGVGLEIHEYPKISFTSEDKIKAHQIITIEPGVYINGKWGMRVEDTVLINEDKQPIVLTKFSKKTLLI